MNIDKNTKVYIAGCGGMLGEAVYRLFNQRAVVKATDIEVNEPWLEYADVRNYEEMRKSVTDFSPNLIINLAALTDMEECEIEQDNAWLTNALGAENLALIANEFDIPLVYISTAGIFGGEKETFNDFDTPNPLSCYAKSKFAGEVFVREHVRRYFVVRAGWMMGGGPKKDKKFVNKIYKQIKAGVKELKVVDDKLGTPTYTHDFANGILALVESDLYGVYNQACSGSSSRHDVALEFVRLLGLERKINVVKVDSTYFKTEYFAPRPASEILVDMKLNARGLNRMRDWRVALTEYATEFSNDLKNEAWFAAAAQSNKNPPPVKPIAIKIITEAPTPHNNFFFGKLSAAEGVDLEVHYVYSPDAVPGRPWKKLPDELPNATRVRSGIGSWFDTDLIWGALFGRNVVHFVIGWNHMLFFLILSVVGIKRVPLLTWFDTPKPSSHPFWHPKRILKAWVIRMINRSPGTVFVTGQLAAKGMTSLGINPAKIRTLPFFVPDSFEEMPRSMSQDIRSRFGLAKDDVVILAAGRMIHSKGFDILLEALSQCRDRLSVSWATIFVGSGPELEQLKNQVAVARLDAFVRFVPWVEADEFAHMISMVDVFVAPARFDPFPTTIISAMRSGVAVIATDGVGSALELISSGDSGIIVKKDSPADLADALVSIVNSKEIRVNLGERAINAIARWPVEQGVFEVLDAAKRSVEDRYDK